MMKFNLPKFKVYSFSNQLFAMRYLWKKQLAKVANYLKIIAENRPAILQSNLTFERLGYIQEVIKARVVDAKQLPFKKFVIPT